MDTAADTSRHTIVELRLAHLRAAIAAQRGWYHVAVQHHLYCMDQVSLGGDAKAAAFFASQLAQSYRAMGLEEKASQFEVLR